MKKLVIFFMFFIMCFGIFSQTFICFAEDEESVDDGEIYVVYDEYDNYITERNGVRVEDVIITKDFAVYEVYLVDEVDLVAKAKCNGKIDRPAVTRKPISQITSSGQSKKIGIYMTHNDESYLDADGTSSVYGAGGIHDVAKKLVKNLNGMGIETVFSENLHIPHDSGAYSRSAVTAKKMLKENDLDAIFDIHRDGVSRVNYAVTYGGKERCKVKIVVGQANPNKEENLKFALYLMSVAESVYPWLFTDVYFAKGNYNQDLTSKSLLFEMGTHTIEKELVLETTAYLADVINTTLYGTSVDKSGNLTIGDVEAGSSVNDVLNEQKSENKNSFGLGIFFIVLIVSGVTIWYILRKKVKKSQKN